MTVLKQVDWQNIGKQINSKSNLNLKTLNSKIFVEKFWIDLVKVIKVIPLQKVGNFYNATKTIENLPELINTEIGTFTSREIKDMIIFIYNSSRSKILPDTQKHYRELSTLVPIFLAVKKDYQNINYMDWDINDEFFPYFLGRQLSEILQYKDLSLTNDEILEYRQNFQIKDLTKPINKKVYIKDIMFKPFSVVPPILLQLWMANSSLRHDNMILDLQDWDNKPEAFDSGDSIKPSLTPSNRDYIIPF